MKGSKVKYNIWKGSDKLRLSIIFIHPHVYGKVFTDEYHPSGHFAQTGTETDGVSPLIYEHKIVK